MAREQRRSDVGVYAISVVAEIAGVDPQTLRLYERHRLLIPERTAGGTRRYSDDDLVVLTRIRELVGAGINLAGIAWVLRLEADNAALETQVRAMREACAAAKNRLPQTALGTGSLSLEI